MMNNYPTCQFTAKLHLFATEQGGRKTSFNLGYRPLFRLNADGPNASASIDAIENDKESMSPGESANVEMTLLYPQEFLAQLEAGTKFEICEGLRAIGSGVIKEIKQNTQNTGRIR